jgi:putative DNA primase/helicase
MIVKTEVLKAVAPKWPKGGLFASAAENLIGGWCVTHFRKYGKAPGKSVQGIFESWGETRQGDDATIQAVGKILGSLSDEYETKSEINPAELLDVAERHFQSVQLAQQEQADQQDRESGDLQKVWERRKSLRPFSLNGKGDGLVPLSAIEPQSIAWLWRGWVPQGELTIIDGDMGTGKSQITIDLAARVSRGWQMPPAPRKPFDGNGRRPANVIILSSEDEARTTIRPRFDVADGDPERILVLDTTDSEKPPMMFPSDLPRLEELIVKHSARLVVVDPFYGFLDGKVDANTDHKIRGPLRGLSDIAHRTRAAIILTRHLNKKQDTDPLYRGGGSVAVAAHCPCAIILGRDPANRDTRIMAANRIKHVKPAASLAYDIEEKRHPNGGMSSRVEWQGETELEAKDILNQTRQKGRPSKMGEYVEYIRELLADGKELPSDNLMKSVMRKFGIGESTCKAARKQAGVRSKKQGFQGEFVAYIAEQLLP